MNSKTLCSTTKKIRHKMRRIKGKKHKMKTYEIHYLFLMTKDGIHIFACFHKDIDSHK